MGRKIKHGLSKHPLYVIWVGIKARCYYESTKSYIDYGLKGVKMCDEWLNDFKSFYDWAIENGWEKGLQIDKDIKGDGTLYSPETCAIITRKENMNKRKDNYYVTYNGQIKTLSEWQDVTGINQSILWDRIERYNWSIEKSLTTKIVDKRKRIECLETGEIFESIAYAAKYKKINRPNIISVLNGRMAKAGGFSFKYLNS